MNDRRFFTTDRLALLGIVLLSAIVYLPALSGLPILDDRMISSGAAIGGGDSFLDCLTKPFLYHYFRPLVSVSFWLEMRIHGANPFLLHQTNILFHVLTTYFVVKLAQACGISRTAALWGGFFFAIQPAQVGAVAWIGGRTDSQACLFFVVMLLSIARFYASGRWWWVPIGALAGLFAMLTKEQVLPAVLLAPLGGLAFSATKKKTAAVSIPYLAAGLLFFVLWILNSPEQVKGANVPMGEVASQVARTTVDYGLLFLAPNPWSLQSYTLENFRGSYWTWIGAFGCVAIVFGIGKLWHYDRRLGWLALGAGLVYLPVSNLIPIPSLLVAPYRVALSGPAVAILLGVLVSRIRVQRVAAILALAGAAISVYLTPWGAARHKDELTLFDACVRFDPECSYMRYNYLIALQGKGRLSEAMAQSETLFDKLFVGHDWRQYAHIPEDFEADPTIAQRILDTHGTRAEAGPFVSRYLVAQAQILGKLDRKPEAEAALRAALQMDRKNDDAYFGLGQLVLAEHPDDGVYCLREAIALNPENAGAVYALGRYYIDRHDDEKAYRTLIAMLRIPNDTGAPLMDFAEVALRLGHKTEAQAALARAAHLIVDRQRLAELVQRAF